MIKMFIIGFFIGLGVAALFGFYWCVIDYLRRLEMKILDRFKLEDLFFFGLLVFVVCWFFYEVFF